MNKSELEAEFLLYIRASRLPKPEEEFKFDKKRRWRFDFAYPKHKIAIEIEGGIWTGGRHTRATGFIKDCEKYNRATILGWRVLRYHRDSMGQAIIDIKELIS
jgi:very-short-patch-repair endonuclease